MKFSLYRYNQYSKFIDIYKKIYDGMEMILED